MSESTRTRRIAARSATAMVAGAAVAAVMAPGASAQPLPGYSESVAHTAVDTLSAQAGVSTEQARQVLVNQQGGVTDLKTAVTALGGQEAGGFINDNGDAVVNVLSDSAAAKVRATGAQARHVDYSSAQLTQTQDALEALPAVSNTSIGLDPEANQVVLTVADAAKQGPKLTTLLRTAKGMSDQVDVRHVDGGMSKAIQGGEAIRGGGYRCSAGFNASKGGTNYVVDAGHCTADVSEWDVGPSVDSSFPGNDYGLIRNTTGSAPGTVSLYNGSSQRISGASNASSGERICKSGSTTGLTCGQVTQTNVTVRYQAGSVSGLIETSANVDSGDSGGSLFDGSTALGITSGMGGGSSYFQPVTEALNAYGLQLN